MYDGKLNDLGCVFRVVDILVNGKRLQVEAGSSVGDLLQQLEVRLDYTVIEKNSIIVSREQFDIVKLSSGDQVEIISFIGGGCGCVPDP